MSATGSQTLWPHQRDAVDATLTALSHGPRATIVAACGSGKTRVGAEIADRLTASDGHLLIVAPTLELIAQTLRVYRATLGEANVGALIAVCSDHGAVYQSEVDLGAEDAEVTTDPRLLAVLLSRPGRATVACTYESLTVLAEAHAEHGLRPWDIAVVDEAHRTAGVGGRPWALIHDAAAIPAQRRLYLTATPRLLADRGDERGVSMDDEKIFGPTCYTLTFARAIEQGLLADYQVIVPVITDEHVHALIAKAHPDAPFLSPAGRAAVSPQILAVQVALLRAAAQHGLRRIITYHRTVAAAEAFASSLHAAVGLLDEHEQPSSLTARAVSGAQRPHTRRPILARLGGQEPGLVVVSNARVLAEGVDLPAVDAVMFVDPRDSTEAVVQAVGRALRTGGRRDKVATAIVPVLLSPQESPESALESSAFASVWRTIRALRAHDERLAFRLDQLRFNSGAGGAVPAELGSLPQWMRLTGVPVPASFAAAVNLRMLDEAAASWHGYYGRATAFHTEHGHLSPPRGPLGDPPMDLGTWLNGQRLKHRAGALSAERTALLERLGIEWEPQSGAWHRGLEAARAHHAEHGDLKAVGAQYRTLRTWLNNQRAKHAAGELEPGQVAALERLGIAWSVHAEAWARGHRAARDYHALHANLAADADTVAGDPPFPLGTWLAVQRGKKRAGKLTTQQIAQLEKLGIDWDPQQNAWEQQLEAARAFREEHGHLLVRPSQNPRLSAWLTDQREARVGGRLTDARRTALDALDMVWSVADEEWQRAAALAQNYHAQHGDLLIPSRYVVGDPSFNLGKWLAGQRAKHRDGKLAAYQVELLERLGIDWDPLHTAWQQGLCAARVYHTANGHLRAPRTARIGDPPYPLGSWLHTVRKDRRAGKLAPERAAALDELGIVWDPGKGRPRPTLSLGQAR